MKLTDLVDIPRNINQGVTNARQQSMLTLLGNPRGSYDQTCKPITNPTLKPLVVTASVGPFRATGLRPAIESLTEVMADIALEQPEVHGALSSAGMQCSRFVRGSTTSISNHSWGCAIDLKVDGVLDAPGNRKVLVGLARIAPIFNRHGWFWGAGFSREDAMHFEVSDEKIRRWHRFGLFAGRSVKATQPMLSFGDRGPDVKELQRRLNQAGARLKVDGDFGRNTMAAVMAFQAETGLKADGVVDSKTLKALGL